MGVYKLIFLLLLFVNLISCNPLDLVEKVPRCLKKKIRKERKSCLNSVVKYDYKGEIHYMFKYKCDTEYEVLYNESCEIVCYPSVNSSEQELCEDYFTAEKLTTIWQESAF